MIAVSVPDLLRKYRKDGKHSQEAMANFLSVSQATYHNWESGKFRIAFRHYPNIVRVCGKRMKDILPPELRDGEEPALL